MRLWLAYQPRWRVAAYAAAGAVLVYAWVGMAAAGDPAPDPRPWTPQTIAPPVTTEVGP